MKSQLIEFLNIRQWKYSSADADDIILFPISHRNGMYNCVADIREDDFMLVFLTLAGTYCPPEKRTELIALFNRVNSKLIYGNFEMYENGQFKFRTSNLFENTNISGTIIAKIIDNNVNIMDFAFPYFLDLMHGKATSNEVFNYLYPEQPQLEDGKKMIEDVSAEG